MEKIKQDDPGDLDSASNETSASSVPERTAEPLWKTVLKYWLPAVAATGIFGALFQLRQWTYEKAVNKIQDDTTKVLYLEQQVGEFIDEWLAAAEEIGHSIQSHMSSKEWERAWNQYSKNFEGRARQLNKLAGQIAFFVDTPFIREADEKHILSDDKRKEIYGHNDDIAINCLTYTLEFATEKNIDVQSATHLLQIIAHCHDLAKGDIEQASADRNRRPPVPCDEKQEENRICDFKNRKSHIWWLNNVLRCTILDRAVTIRDVQIIWNPIPQIPSNYDLPGKKDARDCVKDYRDNDYRGLEGNPWRLYKKRMNALRNKAR